MHYIDRNFTTFDDLRQLDDKINDLKKRQQDLEQEASKLTGSTVDSNKPKSQAVGEILSVIRQIGDSDPESCIDEINGLMDKFGCLSMLKESLELLERKKSLHNLIEDLEALFKLEEEIVSFDATNMDNFENLHKRLCILKDGSMSSSSPEIVSLLNQLEEKFQSRVREAKVKQQTDFAKFLREINWLSSSDSHRVLSGFQQDTLHSYLNSIMDFQKIYSEPRYPETWWALETLLEPLVVRFKYHFSDPKKDTNKITKPEWALNFMEDILAAELSYLHIVIANSFKLRFVFFDYEIITTLLRPLRTKLFEMNDVINNMIVNSKDDNTEFEKNGRLLSHLIFELINFDERIRSTYLYNPYIIDKQEIPTSKWIGLTGELFSNSTAKSTASNWLNFEFQLASRSFKELMEDFKAFEIDQHFTEENSSKIYQETKPTYSAYNLCKLFDTLTTHHETLTIVKYQLKYVSNIQLKVLELYCNTIDSTFKEIFGHKFIRNFIGSDIKGEIRKNDMDSFQKLTSLYNSAQFVFNKLEEWGNQLIFIQIWNSFKSIRDEEIDISSTLFDDIKDLYDQLLKNIRAKYEQIFKKTIRESLKQYINSTHWDQTSSAESEPSYDLTLLVDNIPVYLSYLKRTVSDVDYVDLSNMFLTITCAILREYILKNAQFTINGIRQFDLDFHFLMSNIRPYMYCAPFQTGYNLCSNYEYCKITTSVKFLSSVLTSPDYKPHFGDFQTLRGKFTCNLEVLNDDDIGDLVRRAIF